MTEETLETRAARVLGIDDDLRIGRAVFDDRFYIEGFDQKKIRGAMQGGLADAIAASFSLGVTEIVVKGGELRARFPESRQRKLSAEKHRALLELLARAASAFDRVEIEVANLGARKALRGRGALGRCGYCHADLSGDEPDLVACATCSTVLHEGCWDELARCPVLGCRGDRPERGASRGRVS